MSLSDVEAKQWKAVIVKSRVTFKNDGGIVIELRGARKVFSARKSIILETNQIKNVQLVSHVRKPRFYKKIFGTNGWYYGGWFRENGMNEFWDVKDAAHVLVLETRHFKYNRIYIEVDKDFRLKKRSQM